MFPSDLHYPIKKPRGNQRKPDFGLQAALLYPAIEHCIFTEIFQNTLLISGKQSLSGSGDYFRVA